MGLINIFEYCIIEIIELKGVNMLLEYYKKIDKSFFDKGITIPNKYIDSLTKGTKIKKGSSKKITIIFNKKKYIASIIIC